VLVWFELALLCGGPNSTCDLALLPGLPPPPLLLLLSLLSLSLSVLLVLLTWPRRG
jgi:hypothetical protein